MQIGLYVDKLLHHREIATYAKSAYQHQLFYYQIRSALNAFKMPNFEKADELIFKPQFKWYIQRTG